MTIIKMKASSNIKKNQCIYANKKGEAYGRNQPFPKRLWLGFALNDAKKWGIVEVMIQGVFPPQVGGKP